MGKTKTTSNNTTSQNQTSTTAMTDWSRQQFDNNVNGILGTIDNYNTNSPYRPYTGQMVAGLSGSQQQARDLARNSVGSWNGILGDAETAAREGGSMTWTPDSVSSTDVAGPTAVEYRTFDPTRVEARMNPYESQVVDAAGAYYDEQLGRRMSENQARATASGSYGGSRHGIADAELQRTSNLDRSQMMADLRYRGWNDAVAGDERESGNLYNAATRNSDVDYSSRRDNAVRADDTSRFNASRNDAAAQFNSNQRLASASMLGTLAGQRQQLSQNDVSMMESLGATEREIEQARLLAERAQYDDQAADEWRRMQLELQTRIGILGATPILTTTNSSGTGTSTGTGSQSGLAQYFAPVGGLLSGIGALGNLWGNG